MSNEYEVTAERVFPLYTGSRTVKIFDSCLFWLSLFVYIQAATVCCAEAAMSLFSHTHTLDWYLMLQPLAALAANTCHGFPSSLFQSKGF